MKTNRRWIDEQLLKANMNQKDLAELWGLDSGATSRTVNGRRKLRLDEASKLVTKWYVPLYEVLKQFGITDEVESQETLPIIASITTGGILIPVDTQDRVPVVTHLPNARYVIQWREQSSVFDGWLFYISQDLDSVESNHYSVLKLDDGREVLGYVHRGYVPGKYNIAMQGNGNIEAGIKSQRRVLGIIPT